MVVIEPGWRIAVVQMLERVLVMQDRDGGKELAKAELAYNGNMQLTAYPPCHTRPPL